MNEHKEDTKRARIMLERALAAEDALECALAHAKRRFPHEVGMLRRAQMAHEATLKVVRDMAAFYLELDG